MSRHIGRLRLSQELILEIVHFEGGRVQTVQIDPLTLSIELVIEHPDMPIVVGEGALIPEVSPAYRILPRIKRQAKTYERVRE